MTKGKGVASLSNVQAGNAAAIVNVGKRLGLPEKAYVIAIATALQESDLGANTSTTRPNGDGDAGVFQQRCKPGWYGTLEQVNNIEYAATVFYTGKKLTAADVKGVPNPAGPVGYTIPGLIQIRGWESMPVTVAAQAVQRSAYPLAYAKHETRARAIVADILNNPNNFAGASAGVADGTIGGINNMSPITDFDPKRWLLLLIGLILVSIAIARLSGAGDAKLAALNVVAKRYTGGVVSVK